MLIRATDRRQGSKEDDGSAAEAGCHSLSRGEGGAARSARRPPFTQEWRKKMSLATGRGAWHLGAGAPALVFLCSFALRDPRRCLRALQSHGQVRAGTEAP